ncbi:MAG: hypothetical protein ABH934_03020 [Chloroflexota bacterium]
MRNISLFYHYRPNEIVNSASLNWTAVSVYAGVSIVCFVAALVIFQKRDLVT